MITELVKRLNPLFNDKVYPTNAPEGEKPNYLVYQYKESETKSLEGYEGLLITDIVLNAMTKSFKEANDKSKVLKALLLEIDRTKIGDYSIQEVTFDQIEIVYENELKIYRAIVPATIYFEEE